MRRTLFKFLAVFSLQIHLFSATWTSPAVIDNTLVEAAADVTTCYDSTNHRIFAAWKDTGSGRPAYSIYSSGSWSTPAFIDRESFPAVNNNVFLCYDSANDVVFAAWRDTNNSNRPYYAIYSGGIWSIPAAIIDLAISSPDVFLSYDSANDRVFATWMNTRPSPVFSIYDSGSGTWGPSAPNNIINGGVFTPASNVYTCFDAANNDMLVAWVDAPNTQILYGVYTGGAPAWDQATLATSIATNNAFLCSTNSQVFATWIDKVTEAHTPTYSIYNGTTWTAPAQITTDEVSSTSSTLFTCFDSTNNRVFAAWGDESGDPTYSIYSGGSWTTNLIDGAPPSVLVGVALSYDAENEEVFATFADVEGSGLPYYSIFQSSAPDCPREPQ